MNTSYGHNEPSAKGEQDERPITTDATANLGRHTDQEFPAKAPSSLSQMGSGSWLNNIESAIKRWSKITEEELKEVADDTNKLIDLVQMRYVISKEKARQQVQRFLRKH
ncbi:hypothetical protein P2G88_19075 [Aliiglaciecola sp. CAU 1673]|uniref:hypothetical protein n=1 Tax=Aliiglaciecola sp. CAU 1673 TaxID=3032595 RepID=UPI0023DBEB65|nr:hypothetical protein [Aliiglaciecola sp. CAU 1673]MDF2180366.1 hypothetical protein [Aliiglaciecola sp. CAU 1673]